MVSEPKKGKKATQSVDEKKAAFRETLGPKQGGVAAHPGEWRQHRRLEDMDEEVSMLKRGQQR